MYIQPVRLYLCSIIRYHKARSPVKCKILTAPATKRKICVYSNITTYVLLNDKLVPG